MLNKQLTGPNLSVTRRFGATLKKRYSSPSHGDFKATTCNVVKE